MAVNSAASSVKTGYVRKSIEGPAGIQFTFPGVAACTDGSLMLGDIAPGRLARDSAMAKMMSSFRDEMFLNVFLYGSRSFTLKRLSSWRNLSAIHGKIGILLES